MLQLSSLVDSFEVLPQRQADAGVWGGGLDIAADMLMSCLLAIDRSTAIEKDLISAGAQKASPKKAKVLLVKAKTHIRF